MTERVRVESKGQASEDSGYSITYSIRKSISFNPNYSKFEYTDTLIEVMTGKCPALRLITFLFFISNHTFARPVWLHS